MIFGTLTQQNTTTPTPFPRDLCAKTRALSRPCGDSQHALVLARLKEEPSCCTSLVANVTNFVNLSLRIKFATLMFLQ